jgi:hypothetical protein
MEVHAVEVERVLTDDSGDAWLGVGTRAASLLPCTSSKASASVERHQIDSSPTERLSPD